MRPRSLRLLLFLPIIATSVLVVPPSAAATPVSYVALGDSYTAGPLIPPSDGGPLGCLRSAYNYPHLLAAFYRITDFRDKSCSGARTGNITGPQPVLLGVNPTQLDSLKPDTKYVTLQIGGNDMGYSEIALSCLTLIPDGSPCKSKYTASGVDQLSERIVATAPRIDNILATIEQRSPDSQVFVVGYPAVFPDTGNGCWPTMPFATGDVPYIRDKEKELNLMLKTRAEANGAVYVDTYTPSIGHDACAAPAERWVEPIVPAQLAAPVHPNSWGMIGMAIEIAKAVAASGG